MLENLGGGAALNEAGGDLRKLPQLVEGALLLWRDARLARGATAMEPPNYR